MAGTNGNGIGNEIVGRCYKTTAAPSVHLITRAIDQRLTYSRPSLIICGSPSFKAGIGEQFLTHRLKLWILQLVNMNAS